MRWPWQPRRVEDEAVLIDKARADAERAAAATAKALAGHRRILVATGHAEDLIRRPQRRPT